MHNMDCHIIHSRIHVGLSVYVCWFNASVRNTWKSQGKVTEFVDGWRVAALVGESVSTHHHNSYDGFRI